MKVMHLFEFVFPTTGATHQVQASNEKSAFRKFVKLVCGDENFARKFKCRKIL